MTLGAALRQLLVEVGAFGLRHGVRTVANLRGGFDAWVADDLPVEREK